MPSRYVSRDNAKRVSSSCLSLSLSRVSVAFISFMRNGIGETETIEQTNAFALRVVLCGHDKATTRGKMKMNQRQEPNETRRNKN